MPVQFQILPDQSGAFDFSGPATRAANEKVDELAGAWEEGRLSEKRFQTALEQQLQQTPWLLEAHNFLASLWFDMDKPVKALEAAKRGLEAANSLIPESFSGRIEWGHLENRPYLRLMHIAVLCMARRGKHKDAAQMASLMLARNPNDNQGVRFMLGSELLRAGMRAEAIISLQESVSEYPAGWYELGLCHAIEKNWVAAATAFRHGFAANHYIAETLIHEHRPLPLVMHHASNLEDPSGASEYMDTYGDLWLAPNGAKRFLHWLYNHPMVMMERAAVLACNEEMLWATDSAAIGKIFQRKQTLEAKIDGKLSEALVQRRTSRRGETGWPWHFMTL